MISVSSAIRPKALGVKILECLAGVPSSRDTREISCFGPPHALDCPYMSLIGSRPGAASERSRTAVRFADVLETEVKARRNLLIVRVITWFNLCRLCQDLEEQMLLSAQPGPEDLQPHRALLSQAISGGEGLLLECGDPHVLDSLAMTPASIDAKIESLRITFEQWHTEINPERQAQILKEVFGGSA